jgi:hypothetical protein
MSDRLFFASAALLAALLIGLAFVWPQGQGKRAPGPFGHAEEITAAARQDLAQEAKDKADKAAKAKGVVAPAAAVPAVKPASSAATAGLRQTTSAQTSSAQTSSAQTSGAK